MDKKIGYTKTICKNGLTLVNISGLPTNSVTLTAYIRAGFRFDPKDRHGLSHFAEHMTFNGTKSFPNPQKVTQTIEIRGGTHEAFTWIEDQKHTIRLPASDFEIGSKLLLETVFKPLMISEEVKREKGVIREEILRNKADSARAVWDYIWFPLFFQGTDLARPYSGTDQDIQRISTSDLKKFTSTYFQPKRTIIFVAGDLEFKYIQEIFDKNILKASNNSLETETYPIIPAVKKNILAYKDKSYYQTSLVIGIKTVPFNSPLKYTFDILQQMLAGYYGTKLIQGLRNQNGLIYSWDSFQDNLSDIGYIFMNLSVAHKNVKKVMAIIARELKRFKQGKFNKIEVEMAKKHLMGNIFTNTETGRDHIEWYGLQELLNPENVLSLEEKIEVYKNIDIDEITQAAKNYFIEENVFVGAIGNVDESSLSM